MTALPKCEACGSRVPADALKCPNCGAPLSGDLPSAPPPAPSPAPSPAGGNGPRLFLVAGGALLAAAVGAGALLMAPTPTANPSTKGASAAGAAGGFAAVRARGTLRVAADVDAAPFLSKSGDDYEGFEYGLMTALASDAGAKLEIVPSSFAELPTRLQDGKADLAIGQLSPSSAYSGLAWSVSYLQYSLCLIVPARSAAHHLADLRGKRIGMYDDPTATQVTSIGVGADYQRVVFKEYGYFDQMVHGQLDAMVYDCPLARHELTAFAGRLAIADDALDVATYNVALRADDPALKTDVDRVLRSLGDQGLLAKLESRWLGASVPTDGYVTTAGRVVVVKRGESLSTIAARELGSADRWKELHEKNHDLIGDDPNVLYAGLRLRMP